MDGRRLGGQARHGQRLEQSGTHWSLPGAAAIISPRCRDKPAADGKFLHLARPMSTAPLRHAAVLNRMPAGQLAGVTIPYSWILR